MSLDGKNIEMYQLMCPTVSMQQCDRYFLLDFKNTRRWYKNITIQKIKQNNCTGPAGQRAYSKVALKSNRYHQSRKAEERACGPEKPLKPSLKRKYSARL